MPRSFFFGSIHSTAGSPISLEMPARSDTPRDEPLPDRSPAWSSDSDKPGQEMIDSAVRATLGHELAIRARGFACCHAVVMIEPKEFIKRCKWDATAKDRMHAGLADTHLVTLVSYHTSDVRPEPLAGGGETFDFVLHPESLEVLHVDTGWWRS
jgi:hypothetical protein